MINMGSTKISVSPIFRPEIRYRVRLCGYNMVHLSLKRKGISETDRTIFVDEEAALEKVTLMQEYQNLGGDSGISGYENGNDYIRVAFSDGSIYLYTYQSAGASNIQHMHLLASNGEGLNSFINLNVRKRYAKKER